MRMKNRWRRSDCPKLSDEALERHLFVCAACRADNRIAVAWSALRESGTDGAASATADERFVTRVLAARARSVARQRQRRLLLAAAAVLLFFFFAGTGARHRATAQTSAEEAYASLATPSALEGLLPE